MKQNPLMPFDWDVWFEFLSQFGEVKDHLLRAGSELVLALKSLIDQIIAGLETERPDMRGKWEFLYALQYALGFLGSRLDTINISDEQQRLAKKSALKSILLVIDAEINGIKGHQLESELSETDKIKLGAMMAIRNVLKREMEKGAASGPANARKATASRRKTRNPRTEI